MAEIDDKIRTWRKVAREHADVATALVRPLEYEDHQENPLALARIAAFASLSAMYYAAALDASQFGNLP
jgi:hypothetical protein